MGATTKISWTNSTFNPWIGCTEAGPGCDFCYARDQDHRWGGDHWGPGMPRKRTTADYWRQLAKWNGNAAAYIAAHGHRQRVFIASMADVYDNEIPEPWRIDLFEQIDACRDLEIQIVTKRIGNARKMTPPCHLKHVGIIATAVTQKEIDRDGPKLIETKKKLGFGWCGFSIEPQLEEIDASRFLYGDRRVDWIISGGESGQLSEARRYETQWAHKLMSQCRIAGVAFFEKQLGTNPTTAGVPLPAGRDWGKHDDPLRWPQSLNVREFPTEPPFAAA